jgi:hypothetical protein
MKYFFAAIDPWCRALDENSAGIAETAGFPARDGKMKCDYR